METFAHGLCTESYMVVHSTIDSTPPYMVVQESDSPIAQPSRCLLHSTTLSAASSVSASAGPVQHHCVCPQGAPAAQISNAGYHQWISPHASLSLCARSEGLRSFLSYLLRTASQLVKAPPIFDRSLGQLSSTSEFGATAGAAANEGSATGQASGASELVGAGAGLAVPVALAFAVVALSF